MILNRRQALHAGAAAFAAALAPRAFAADASALITRPIGGDPVPIVGLGTLGAYENPADEAALAPLRETIRTFVEAGGRVIDTAPAYNRAEEVVGRFISELKIRDRIFLATKVGAPTTAEGKAMIEASFRRLGVEVIDLLQSHSLNGFDQNIGQMRELKAAGKVRHVGITTSRDGQYAQMEEVMRREALDCVQMSYALDDRGVAARLLPLAKERGQAVMINLPFGRGRLFTATAGKALPDWAKAEIDCQTWAQFFLKYVVSHPSVTCVIPGMGVPAYATDNLGAARGRLPDEAQRKRMEAVIDAL